MGQGQSGGGGGIKKEEYKEYMEMSKDRLSKKEIQNLHKLFHTVAPSGEMDIASFNTYCKKVFPQAPEDAKFDHLFRGMDKNKSGHITFNEYLEYHAVYHSANIEELVEVVFAMYDADNDNYVTREEITTCIRNCMKLKGVNVELPENKELIASRVAKLVSLCDSNNDNKLTKDEILAAVRKDPQILNML